MMRAIQLAVVCVAVLVAGQAQAGVIINPVSVSSLLGEGGGGAFPTSVLGNLIDQSGLVTPFVSGVTNWDTYMAGNTATSAGASNFWISDAIGPLGDVDFDLGTSHHLTQLAMWDFGTGAGNGALRDFTVFTSNDPTFASSTNVGSFLMAGGVTDAQIFDIGDSFARYVRIQIDSNNGNANLVGFGEIAFKAVPEPTSMALVGLGAAGLGYFHRRKQKKLKLKQAA